MRPWDQTAWPPAGVAGRCLAMAFLASCAYGSAGPEAALHRYSDALRRHDLAAAYEMMSVQYRERVSKEEFTRMMKENSREVGETAARLRAAKQEFIVTGELRYGLGDTLQMVREDGHWRVASNPVQFYSQETPRDALRSFLRAYRLQRWDVILRFVPQKYRERMTVDQVREQFDGVHREEMASMVNMLEEHIDERIYDKGNEARMPYGDRYEVRFVRENGSWKIQDLD